MLLMIARDQLSEHCARSVLLPGTNLSWQRSPPRTTWSTASVPLPRTGPRKSSQSLTVTRFILRSIRSFRSFRSSSRDDSELATITPENNVVNNFPSLFRSLVPLPRHNRYPNQTSIPLTPLMTLIPLFFPGRFRAGFNHVRSS